MRLSRNFSLRELTKSATAERSGIDNTPKDLEHLVNMTHLAIHILQPVRDEFGVITVNSGYRSPDLNKAVGGSDKSQHCHGQAMDLDDTYGHRSNASMFQHIRYNMDYDQIIWEFGDDKNPAWVHISYVSEEENRHRCLKAVKKNGKTHYELM